MAYLAGRAALRPGRQPLPLGSAAGRRRRRGAAIERVLCARRLRRGRRRRLSRLPPRATTDRILSLLAIRAAPTAPAALDLLEFRRRRRDPARCRPASLCHLEDLGEPWPTAWRPRITVDEAERRAADGAVSRANETLVLALAQGAHPRRGDAAAAPRRHRARARLRRSRFAPAALRDQRSRSRHHPRAQLRRRDLRRLRRGAARRRRQRRADGVRLSRDLRAARSRHRPLPAWWSPAPHEDVGRGRSARAGAMSASPPNIPRSPAAISPRAACRPNASSSTARWSWRRRIGLCRHIVDLVQTGATLQANGLVEIEHIADITSRLIVNRAALKTRAERGRRLDRALPRGVGPMPLRLDRRATPASRRPSPRCSTPSARPTPMSTPRSPRSSPMSRARGDAALIDYTQPLRPARRSTPRRCACRRARSPRPRAPAPAETVAALRLAAERIEAYHRRQMPRRSRLRDAAGVRLGARWRPIARGRALCAGRHRGLSLLGADERDPGQGRRRRARWSWWCRRRTACSTRWCWPRRSSPASTRSTASAARRRWRRWPTAPRRSPPVDKIVGPGNAYVAAAKRRVFGTRRHRHDRRPVGNPGRRRRRQRSRLDRRRSAVAGRARRRGAGDPDHRRRRVSPTRSRRRSSVISRRCRAPRSPRASWQTQRRDHPGRAIWTRRRR